MTTKELITTGGDTRILIDPKTGLNKYGCSPLSRDSEIPFGSCTASSLSVMGYEVAEGVHKLLLKSESTDTVDYALAECCDEIRSQMVNWLTDGREFQVEIVLSASGTDAELLALMLVHGDASVPVSNIVVGIGEVGSGTALAAAGYHFDDLTPSGNYRKAGEPIDYMLAQKTKLFTVRIRNDAGSKRAPADIDREVNEIVEREIGKGRRVLLHSVAHSKTGIYAPDIALINYLQQRYGDKLFVVVDAAQGRWSRRNIIEALQKDHMVIFTGSKFFGGPPFSGALLVSPKLHPDLQGVKGAPEGYSDYFTASQFPKSWQTIRAALPQLGNIGVVLRWKAALEEMYAFAAIPKNLRDIVFESFEQLIPSILGDSPALHVFMSPPLRESEEGTSLFENSVTVFSVAVRDPLTADAFLSASQLRDLCRWLVMDLSFLVADKQSDLGRVLGKNFHVGQPTELGLSSDGPSAFRVALGAPLVRRVASDQAYGDDMPGRLLWLKSQVMTLRIKIETILAFRDRLT
jgi:hypothetical protein